MITLYGSAKSSAGRCIWALEEAGVPFTVKEVDMRNKEHKSAEFLKINPMGKIPALVDGDLNVFESMAINYYIADTYKKDLLGSTPAQKALAMQWSFWASSELQPPVIEIFIQRFFMPEDKRDQNIIDNNLKKLPELLKVLDDSLANKKYLAGDVFTIGDINTASVMSICPAVGIDLSAYKNISLWTNAINDRPAFQKYQALRK
jgi:glutathione S-transferase